jgi:hypothetical protein
MKKLILLLVSCLLITSIVGSIFEFILDTMSAPNIEA